MSKRWCHNCGVEQPTPTRKHKCKELKRKLRKARERIAGDDAVWKQLWAIVGIEAGDDDYVLAGNRETMWLAWVMRQRMVDRALLKIENKAERLARKNAEPVIKAAREVCTGGGLCNLRSALETYDKDDTDE
jgi:hypothetical protein